MRRSGGSCLPGMCPMWGHRFGSPDEGSGRGWVKPATVAGVQCCDLAVVGNLGQLLVCACSVAAVQCNWVELREQ
jgi:hypothetical protein